MDINFSIEEAVKSRSSVRNYSDERVEEGKISLIKSFVECLENPFGNRVNFHYLDENEMKNANRLGTYGVIKGAKNYIGATVELAPMALEAVGYELETVILYLAHLDLGTCWLGGTFNRKGFAKAMKIGENEVFPAITPYGYSANRKHMKEIVMRKIIQADRRKDWCSLFFKNDFQTPLSKEEALDFAFPLEMVRLGPSASNKQPWRIVLKENACHFYEQKEPGYSDIFPYDIQRIDLGIAAAHFDFSVKEKKINGHFDICQPNIELKEHLEYVFSWVRK